MTDGDTDTSSHRGTTERARVLLVDDEASSVSALTRVLQRAGFDVTEATDGVGAMERLAEARFAVVLTDISMPNMDGIALLKAVRERDLDVPVVLMTGYPDVQSAAEAVRSGAFAYLLKPLSSDLVESTVRRAARLGQLGKAKRESIRVLDTGWPEAGDLIGLGVTLDRALDSLWMAYQPIVEATTRELFAYEALLRSAESTLPHPGAVLDAAERLGRLGDVGRTVRARAAGPMVGAPPEALLFVNLHASDLNDEELGAPSAALTSMASRVVLEITERVSLAEVKGAHARVMQLKELGFRLAVDDLGAGYAGLSSFTELEPEFVKLDMSLVRDIDHSPVKQKLVRSMTDLCKDLGITIVAEGIETKAERDCVIELGCDLLQGYLLARPGKPFPEIVWP